MTFTFLGSPDSLNRSGYLLAGPAVKSRPPNEE